MSLGAAIPALPVRDTDSAIAFYTARLRFTCVHRDTGFGLMVRDAAELHLWEAGDGSWSSRSLESLLDSPVRSGAESFIAGTASCRVEVDDIDGLYAELAAAEVLHPIDRGSAVDTDYGTREFATLDLDGNLLTFFRRVTDR